MQNQLSARSSRPVASLDRTSQGTSSPGKNRARWGPGGRPYMVLFAVACRRGVGLKNRHILDADPAVGRPSQARVRFVVKIFRQVLGGGVDHREGLDVVDHLMIETLDDMPHDLAQILEIKEQTSFVEFGSGQRNANFVVMAVRVLALAFIVAQVVSRGKCVFNGYFEHGSPCGRIQRRPRSTPKPIQTYIVQGEWAAEAAAAPARDCGRATSRARRRIFSH